MTPRQRAEMDRLKGRVRLLEQRNRELAAVVAEQPQHRSRRGEPRPLSKDALDRLIWLVDQIEQKPARKRFTSVQLSGSDARLFRRLLNRLIDVPGLER